MVIFFHLPQLLPDPVSPPCIPNFMDFFFIKTKTLQNEQISMGSNLYWTNYS